VAVSVRRRVWLVALFALVLLGYELMPREAGRVTSLLGELCAKANQTRDAATLADLQASLRGALTPELVAHAPELGPDLIGRDEVIARSRDLLTGAPLSFALTDVEAHVTGNWARVDASLIVSVSGSSEQHRDLRPLEVRFRKAAKGWQIEAVDLEPLRPAEPEARP
jgi:hypothetical protein